MSEVLKYTPGPWEVNDGMVTRFPAVKGEGNIVCLSPETEKSIAMWEANARLIAAAPDLLGALKLILAEKAPAYHDCVDNGQPECAWCIASAAITKAEGGEA